MAQKSSTNWSNKDFENFETTLEAKSIQVLTTEIVSSEDKMQILARIFRIFETQGLPKSATIILGEIDFVKVRLLEMMINQHLTKKYIISSLVAFIDRWPAS